MSGSTTISTSAGLFSGPSVDQGVEADLQQLLADSVAAVAAGNAQNTASQASLVALQASIATGATSIGSVTAQGTAALSTALALSLATLQAQGAAAASTAQTAAAQASASATLAAASAAAANPDTEITARAHAGFRNKLINPRLAINQRATPTLTGSGSVGPVFMADRWAFTASNGYTRTVAVAALSQGDLAQMGDETLTNYINLTVSGSAGSTDFECFSQRIEDVHALSGKAVTVSFWARCPTANQFPSLGGSFTQFTGNATVAPAGTAFSAQNIGPSWSRYSFQVAIPSLNGVNTSTAGNDYTALSLYASAGAGLQSVSGNPGVQTATILIAGLQVEVGSFLTALENRPRAVETALCQRYYQGPLQVVLSGYGTAGIQIGTAQSLSSMRVAPTIIPGTSSNSNLGTLVWSPTSGPGIYVAASLAAAGQAVLNATFAATAEL